MRVLFVNPPSLPGTTANREGTAGMGVWVPRPDAFFYPPQTLAYGVALARTAGYDALALDAVGERLPLRAAVDRVRGEHPDVIVVHVAPQTWEADRAFLQAVRERLPNVPCLLIGTGARFVPRDDWAPLADGLLVGDAEAGLVAALAALGSGEEAAGLWRPDRPSPPPAVRLTADVPLPRPAWEALPVARYPFLTLWGSRGCDEACRWCPYVVGWGRPRRARDPEAVAEEFTWLARTFGKPRHMFRDPVFAADAAWVRAFCHSLRRRTARPPAWECEDRPEHLTPDLLADMAAAGCTQVKLGLEVLAADVLVRWQRLPDAQALIAYREAAAQAIRACRQLGVFCHVFIVIGLGECEADLAATEAFLREVPPHHVSVKRFTRYPGVTPPPHTPLPASVLQRWEARLRATARPARPTLARRLRRWVRWWRRG